VMMPEMDGPQACEHIRALRPDIPVVFSSGYTPEAVPFIAAVGKSSQVLQKPYTIKGLSQTIRAALDAPAVSHPSDSQSRQPTPVNNQ
jgi:two-component system cell cycle sensor histidine kinase/response regulator CckA